MNKFNHIFNYPKPSSLFSKPHFGNFAHSRCSINIFPICCRDDLRTSVLVLVPRVWLLNVFSYQHLLHLSAISLKAHVFSLLSSLLNLFLAHTLSGCMEETLANLVRRIFFFHFAKHMDRTQKQR